MPEGENNMYANSFLIQAVESNKDEQVIHIFHYFYCTDVKIHNVILLKILIKIFKIQTKTI